MNAQVLADAFGHLLWVSAALPGAVYDSGPPAGAGAQIDCQWWVRR
jgi:hypothetical protein